MAVQVARGLPRMALGLGVSVVVCSARAGVGAEIPERIFLPPAFGATPASTIIDAQAHYIAAMGDFLVAAATAREINARAVSIELDNWVKHVENYFKRREINREERKKLGMGLGPDEIEQRSIAAWQKRMRERFPAVLKGMDDSVELNWLLGELCGPTLAVQYMVGSEELKALNEPLTQEDKKKIYLTDGGRGVNRLEFCLGEGGVLKVRWPPGLQGEAFAPLRSEFEAARDQLVQERRGGKDASPETRRRIITTLNDLLSTLEETFPHEGRGDSAVFLEYHAAKQYLQSLLWQVRRAIATQDSAVFAESLNIQSDTVLDLVRNMYQSGMVFARPRPGCEGTYRHLLQNMYNIYYRLSGDRGVPVANAPERKQ